MKSDPEGLKPFREKVLNFLQGTGLDPSEHDKILVALSEGFTNAIRHSYKGETSHPIEVTLQEEDEQVVFKIRDYGQPIDISRLKEPQLPPTKPGGLGVHFMKTIMDKMEYNTSHFKGNELILVKFKKKEGKAP